MKICKFCPKKAWARGVCWKHLQRFYRTGDFEKMSKRGSKTIKICRYCGRLRDLKNTIPLCRLCVRKYNETNLIKNTMKRYLEVKKFKNCLTV